MPCAPMPRPVTDAAHQQSGVRVAERHRADAPSDRIVDDRGRGGRRGHVAVRGGAAAAGGGVGAGVRAGVGSGACHVEHAARVERSTMRTSDVNDSRDNVSSWWCARSASAAARTRRQRIVRRVADRRQVPHLAARLGRRAFRRDAVERPGRARAAVETAAARHARARDRRRGCEIAPGRRARGSPSGRSHTARTSCSNWLVEQATSVS